MKKIYVALITPFLKDYSIDYKALRKIVLDLIKKGCDGFIVCGTTAESASLKEDERFSLLEYVIALCEGKVDIIFGCGSNDTEKTLELCKRAEKYNIDGLLLVTPYYNKPTQEGIYKHYSYIAKRCTLPIYLYEVYSRCGCIIEVSTLEKLIKENKNIVGIKYATNDLNRLREIRKRFPDFIIYCGMDQYIQEFEDVEAQGIISVIGHIAMDELVQFYKNGIYAYDDYFKELSSVLFYDTNPIGIKYLMSKTYHFDNILRLPLTSISLKHKELIDTFFDKVQRTNTIK